MLTSDTVRATVRGGVLHPTYVDPAKADLRTLAESLVEIAGRSVEERWSHGELDEALLTEVADLRAGKLAKGLVKLVLDRCDDEVDSPIPPAEVRAAVFRRAVERGPLSLTTDVLGRVTADDVLAEVGAELGHDAEVLSRALYADLPEARVMTGFKALSGEALLHRYNVALVQALLLRAYEVKVTLHKPSTDRTRQLLRYARFYQLLFRAETTAAGLELVLDGPASILEKSNRYGLALASFFPAVVLQEGGWEVSAEVAWGPTNARRPFTVSASQGLVSHLVDQGAWAPRERAWFLERWEAKGAASGWKISEDPLPITLGARGVLLPDFTFTKGKRVAHLEIVGTWRRDWLERRLDALQHHGAGNVILAVSRKLAARAGEALEGLAVVPFAEVVPVDEVLRRLEEVAR